MGRTTSGASPESSSSMRTLYRPIQRLSISTTVLIMDRAASLHQGAAEHVEPVFGGWRSLVTRDAAPSWLGGRARLPNANRSGLGGAPGRNGLRIIAMQSPMQAAATRHWFLGQFPSCRLRLRRELRPRGATPSSGAFRQIAPSLMVDAHRDGTVTASVTPSRRLHSPRARRDCRSTHH
jgi:hypothetical protein